MNYIMRVIVAFVALCGAVGCATTSTVTASRDILPDGSAAPTPTPLPLWVEVANGIATLAPQHYSR